MPLAQNGSGVPQFKKKKKVTFSVEGGEVDPGRASFDVCSTFCFLETYVDALLSHETDGVMVGPGGM